MMRTWLLMMLLCSGLSACRRQTAVPVQPSAQATPQPSVCAAEGLSRGELLRQGTPTNPPASSPKPFATETQRTQRQ
jgi:hypothetical protein